MDCLFDGEWFIPNVVGLDEERPFEYDPEIDHPFWELGECSFEEVAQRPTVDISPEALVKAFEDNKDTWEQLGVDYVAGYASDYEDGGVLDIIQGAIYRADAIVEQVRVDKDLGLD